MQVTKTKSFIDFFKEILKSQNTIIEYKHKQAENTYITFITIPANNNTVVKIKTIPEDIFSFTAFLNKKEKLLYILSTKKDKTRKIVSEIIEICNTLKIKHYTGLKVLLCNWCWRKIPCKNCIKNIMNFASEISSYRKCLTETNNKNTGWIIEWQKIENKIKNKKEVIKNA